MPKAKSLSKNPVNDTPTDPDTLPSQHYQIEHCKSWSVYRRNAERIKALLLTLTPDIPTYINTKKPRSKSFEVVYYKGEDSTVLWTGVKIPPPRKNKFCSDEKMSSLVKELLPELFLETKKSRSPSPTKESKGETEK